MLIKSSRLLGNIMVERTERLNTPVLLLLMVAWDGLMLLHTYTSN